MDAWFDVCTAPAGQPFAFALMDMCVELGEAAACLLLAWLVWRDAGSKAPHRSWSGSTSVTPGKRVKSVS